MNKDRFIFLMNNYTALTDEETMELIQTQKEFPFSQIIHSLAAKGAITNNLAIKDEKLHTAAVYTTDRSVLKAIAGAEKAERLPPPVPMPKVKEEPQPEAKLPSAQIESEVKSEEPKVEVKVQTKQATVPPPPVVAKSAKSEVSLSGDQLIDELYQDLDKLKHLKHDYEVMVEGLDKPSAKSKPVLSTSAPASEKKSEDKPKKRKSGGDGIIDQIKSTKKKIKPSDPKQKEQLDIINQFIKSKPNFSKNAQVTPEPDAVAQDLSESSNAFSDNVVSETLVEILIKQGKREKAVEVLKKLIWKFPQKKAYFAAQIEELKS